MTNPISHQGNAARRNSTGSSVGGNSTNWASSVSAPKKKIDYCWSYNKGVKCKFGKECKFIERCSYCDEASHGVYNCHKLDKDKGSGHAGKKMGKPK